MAASEGGERLGTRRPGSGPRVERSRRRCPGRASCRPPGPPTSSCLRPALRAHSLPRRPLRLLSSSFASSSSSGFLSSSSSSFFSSSSSSSSSFPTSSPSATASSSTTTTTPSGAPRSLQSPRPAPPPLQPPGFRACCAGACRTDRQADSSRPALRRCCTPRLRVWGAGIAPGARRGNTDTQLGWCQHIKDLLGNTGRWSSSLLLVKTKLVEPLALPGGFRAQ
ncbi:putative protein TPRXL [Sciurus carolinensis]|uniref:putative protein TPRXL n=1 Tax=Sciurus carolinensis TaxID=30640 RepID=UPI001FB4956E|nr:putative protein TPRXL [Sciurus carolinensis]